MQILKQIRFFPRGGLLQRPASVLSRKLDEEAPRIWRGLRPPTSFRSSPLPRPDSVVRRVILAGAGVGGGGESLVDTSDSRRRAHEGAS